jgi:hypothetical protein
MQSGKMKYEQCECKPSQQAIRAAFRESRWSIIAVGLGTFCACNPVGKIIAPVIISEHCIQHVSPL